MTQIKTTLLVTYKDSVKDIKNCKHTDDIVCNHKDKLNHVGVEVLHFDTEAEALEAKTKLEKNIFIQAVEFDSTVETLADVQTLNDPGAAQIWSLNPNSNIPNDNMHVSKLINMKLPSTNPDVILAIVDDCIYTQHPDLKGKLVDGYNAFTRTLESQGGEMWLPNKPTVNHGTLVVGAAVAKSNNGVAGASIGGMFNNVKVLPIRAANSEGFMLSSYLVNGLNHAIARGVDVISLSFANTSLDGWLKAAVDSAHAKGIAVFAGRGNSSTDVPEYPASYPNVMAISNVEKHMALRFDSSYGDITFAGNGTGVIRLLNDGTYVFTTAGGTSSATPHVASIYAAIKAVNPQLTREDVIQFMDDYAYKIPDTNKFGKGYPNAVESIRMARIFSNDFIVFDFMYDQPLNKEFTVTFNHAVDPNHLRGVYILDSSTGKEHPVAVKVNPLNTKQVIVTPTKNYTSSSSYALVVADLINASGYNLGNGVLQIFGTI